MDGSAALKEANFGLQIPPLNLNNLDSYEYLDADELQSLFSNISFNADNIFTIPDNWTDLENLFAGTNGTVVYPSSTWLLNQNQNTRRRWRPWSELNVTEKDAYLRKVHGPRSLDQSLAVPMTVFYLVLFFAGIPGNLLTCLIILWNSYMRAPPNFFLFNLAIADIITLIVVMPMEIFLIWNQYPWPFGQLGCSFVTVTSELVTHVSIITMIAFTIERYTAICHPMQPSLHSGKSQTICNIIVIWIVCLIPSFGWTHFTNVKYLRYGPKDEIIQESAMCIVSPDEVTPLMTYLTMITTIVLYIFPIIFLPILYTKIAFAMRESENLNCENSTISHPSRRNRRTVIRMQIAVIACFLICWTPFHVQRMMFVIATLTDKWSKTITNIQGTLHIISGGCYYLSSTVNPFLYSLLSKRFRRGFHDVLRYACGRFVDVQYGLSTGPKGAAPAAPVVKGQTGPTIGDGIVRNTSVQATVRPQKIRLQNMRMRNTAAINRTEEATSNPINTLPTGTFKAFNEAVSMNANYNQAKKKQKYKLLYVSQHRCNNLPVSSTASMDCSYKNYATTKSCPTQLLTEARAINEISTFHHERGSCNGVTNVRTKSLKRFPRETPEKTVI